MTSLRHHGGDRWSIRAYVGVNPLTGKPRRRSISFRANGRKAAEKMERKLGQQLDDERDNLAASGSIAELVADWLALAERDRSPSTLLAYRRHTKRITGRFGTVQAVDLKASDIDRWYTAQMAAGMTPTNLLHVHRVFAAILRFGYLKGRLSTVETQRVTLPRAKPFEKQIPTDAEVRRIITELPDTEWARAVRLFAVTGMRRGEVVGLCWSDWHGNYITVRHSVLELPGGGVHLGETKGKRKRDVLLPAEAQTILAAQQAVTGGERFVFGGAEPARPGWVSLMWRRWSTGKDRNLGHITPHAFRHWYATYALESGAPLASVAAQLGHAQTSTTLNIYAAKTDAGRQAVADAIDRVMLPAP